MRLFIAIPLPPDVRRALSETQTALIAAGATGRFVPIENYHITLHFIGETTDLADAASAMHEAVRDARPFLLRLGNYGSFLRAAGRTSYIGVGGNLEELDRLYQTLETALFEHGFSRNHTRLLPHITLGRNVVHDEGLTVRCRDLPLTADAIVLYESTNERGRIHYTPVHKEIFR